MVAAEWPQAVSTAVVQLVGWTTVASAATMRSHDSEGTALFTPETPGDAHSIFVHGDSHAAVAVASHCSGSGLQAHDWTDSVVQHEATADSNEHTTSQWPNSGPK